MTTNFSKIAHLPVTTMPSEVDILSIPLARAGEFQLSPKECKTLRSRIYSLNKNNAAGRRWRTLRDGDILLVWRIR